MELISHAFENGSKIPNKYTAYFENIIPPLSWSDVPMGVKSFALIMDDPDIPDFAKEKFGIEVWDHWVVFNIPANLREIKEGIAPIGASGVGTRKEKVYMGPRPPDKEHRYFFKIYALDSMLNISEGSTKTEVEKAMDGHVLAKAELVGLSAPPKK